MVRPVNLNRYRKQVTRAKDQVRAAENAARFGRGKAGKELERARHEKAGHDLDLHRKDP